MASPIADFVVSLGTDGRVQSQGTLSKVLAKDDNLSKELAEERAEMEKAEKQGFHEFFKLSTKINTSNMVCFDFDGKIKKYNSAEEIIEDFYPKRLAYYQKRKVCPGH